MKTIRNIKELSKLVKTSKKYIRLLAKLYLQTKIIKTTYNYCSQIEGWYSRTISLS